MAYSAGSDEWISIQRDHKDGTIIFLKVRPWEIFEQDELKHLRFIKWLNQKRNLEFEVKHGN